MRLFARLRCWWFGHEEYRFVDAHARSFGYQCVNCGRESAVTCDYNEPRVTQHGDQMRHVVFNSRLVQQPKSPAWWVKSVHLGKGA
jgi:hypothetical protein